MPTGLPQVEVHPYHRNDALIAFCRAHSIQVTAFSPLGSPDSASIFPRKRPLVLMEDATVQAVAERSGRNVGQVLIRWALQHGTSVIPKSTSPARIKWVPAWGQEERGEGSQMCLLGACVAAWSLWLHPLDQTGARLPACLPACLSCPPLLQGQPGSA
jgi:hypothetical protein